jgi:hypothetical protein
MKWSWVFGLWSLRWSSPLRVTSLVLIETKAKTQVKVIESLSH